MTTVKYFHSELPGAPVCNGLAGSLVAVLDACLTTGWGLLTAQTASVSAGVCTLGFATGHSFEALSVALVAGAGAAAINGEQRVSTTTTNSISFPVSGVADGSVSGTITVKLAPAGWSKLYAGTNKAAYVSAAPDASGCVVRIDDATGRYARLRAYKTMTDVDTGVGPTPLDAQLAGGLYIPKADLATSTARRWVVVASDRFVHVGIANSSNYPLDYASIAFGDFPSLKAGDAYNCIVIGDTSDTSASGSPGTNNALHASGGATGAYIVCGYAQVGGSIPAYLYKPGFVVNAFSGQQGSGTTWPAGPNPINGSIEICPTLLLEDSLPSGNRRGEVPGLYGIPHALGSAFDNKDQITPAIGLPGHVLVALRFHGYATAAQSSRYAIDVTGPWG